MNSNKFSKYMKKKIGTSFNMGQNNTASSKAQSCSIFSVDEGVKFVVDSNDDSFSAAVPIDSNYELTAKTYTEKKSITYTTTSKSDEPFQFSVFSDEKALPSEDYECEWKVKYPSKKRKSVGKFCSLNPRKVLKTEISQPAISKHISRNSVVPKTKSKTVYDVEDLSSDSDIEVVEFKVVNPQSMGNFLRKPLQSHIDSNNKKKPAHTSNKKNETAVDHVSKSCFMTGKELIVNEADTAPFMPNNPSLFPDFLSVPNSMNWMNSNSSLQILRYNEHSVIKQETSPIVKKEPLLLKKSLIDKGGAKRELKNLYENLNEISWTHETSFRNLLRNPDYIRHSERSTGRIAGTGKDFRKIKPSQSVKRSANKNKTSKKFLTAKSSLKKINSAKSNLNKKLAITAPNSKSRPGKPQINMLIKSEKNLPVQFSEDNLFGKNSKKKVSDKDKKRNSVKNIKKSFSHKEKKKKISVKEKKDKNPLLSKKIKSAESKCSPTGIKIESTEKNVTNLKNIKKLIPPTTEKMNAKVKKKNLKLKGEKPKPAVISKENKAVAQPKVEISEASSSGLQNSQCKDSLASASHTVPKPNNKNGGNSKKYLCKEDLQVKRFELFQDCMKNYYSGFQRELRVEVQPLEFTHHWKTLYYEDFRKAFMHQALRQALEKKEPNCIAAMLQELCDSYMMPPGDEKGSKKKKPEEEALRSSARHINGAFRYKEIAVKKMSNYIQVLLVPSSSKRNILSVDAIKELKEAFLIAKKDPKCKGVLLNSSGSYFCSGIDLSYLIGSNKKQACEEMASVIRELILVLGTFTKPVVAAVNGAAIGFGVALLAYCDVVLASDKASFCIPSTSIGYMPEGGLTLTLPQIVGNIRCSEMLLQGKKITAQEAQAKGLVNEVLWPSRFMNEVMPRFEAILSQTLPVMEATKLLVRANVWDKLRSHMDFERRLIVSQWLSAPCQEGIKNYLRLHTYIDE